MIINRIAKTNDLWQPRSILKTFRGQPFGWDFDLQRFAGTPWYINKDASGLNNGTSWVNAWESFADIVWGSFAVGDTLFISGGVASKTYLETLTVGKSGSSGNVITITKGTDAGHDGTVVIDGGSTRLRGIYVLNYDYITAQYIRLQNHIEHKGSINFQSASYCTAKHLTIDNAKCCGALLDIADHCVIEYCNIGTGLVTQNYQTDSIYAQNGNDNILRYNVCVMGNNHSTPHFDCIQGYQDSNLIVDGNWCEITNGRGNNNSQAMLFGSMTNGCLIVNNVVLGSSLQPSQALYIGDMNGAMGRVYNNIIIAQHPTGNAFFTNSSSSDFTLKNNILYSPGGYCMYITWAAGLDPNDINYNQLYRASGADVAYIANPVEEQGGYTWTEWQAAGYDVNGHNINPSSEWNPGNEYRPLQGATSIENGVDLSAYFTKDRDGRTRPAGSQWDIGAYENTHPYSTLIGTLVTKRNIIGTTDAISALTGGLAYLKKGFWGTIASVTTFVGKAKIEKIIKGAFANTASFTGEVYRIQGIAGLMEVVSSMTGTVDTTKIFAGTFDATSGTVGNIHRAKSLIGLVEAVSALNGYVKAGAEIWVSLDGIIFFIEG